MENIHTREQFDAQVQEMIGLTLSEVVYYEIEYENPEPGYLYKPDIGHFLDFGIDLVADDGKCFSFLWDGTFCQYGLGIYSHSAEEEIITKRRWLVANDPNWIPLICKTINSAEVYWSWVAASQDAPKEIRSYYPQDIVLSFSSNYRVYVSASQYWEATNKVMGASNNILIVFSDQIASKHQLGSFAVDS